MFDISIETENITGAVAFTRQVYVHSHRRNQFLSLRAQVVASVAIFWNYCRVFWSVRSFMNASVDMEMTK